MTTLSEDYQTQYNELFKVMDASPEDHVTSLCFLIEDLIETLQELEKVNCEQALCLASAKRTQEFIKQLKLDCSKDN